MKINGVICPKCEQFVYSRARHDFHACDCGYSMIDGGLDYQRVLWGYPPDDPRYDLEDMPSPKSHTMDLDVTEKELYDDWNKRYDNYGWKNV